MKKIFFVFIIFPFISIGYFPLGYCLSESPKSQMTEQEYQNAVRFQNQYHQIYRSGSQAEKQGDYVLAIEYYERGLSLVKGSGPETIFRSKLRTLQEEVGNYEEALKHTQWFLEKSDKSLPLYPKDIETRTRLLRKIEAQKSWEVQQDPVVPKFREGFKQASPEKQKEFLEGLGAPGVMDAFKNALVAEHTGDFKKALGIYEGLLPKKLAIQKELGIDGWVMLYPAIQRNAEMSGDTTKEKEALLWMKENLLPDNAPFNTSLPKLLPRNVAHIEKRIKDYKL